MSNKLTFTVFALLFIGMAGSTQAQDVATQSQRLVPSIQDSLPILLPNRDLDIDLEGDFAVLGFPNSGAAGEALVFERSGGLWAEAAAPLLPSSPAGVEFGQGVAVSGNWIAVGQGSGEAVDLFNRVSGVWSFAQRLDAPSVGAFGLAVAMDGDTLVVGAPETPTVTDPAVGAAHVYRLSTGAWTLEQSLFHPGGFQQDRIGFNVAIDGDTLVLGASEVGNYNTQTGFGLVYARTGNTWTEEALLRPTTGYSLGLYGETLDLSGDTVVIGNDNGDVYVFDRVGSTWSQTQRIYPAGLGFFRFLPRDLALDGDRLVLGNNRDNGSGPVRGAAYLYTRSGGTWSETQAIFPSGPTDDSLQFGRFVGFEGSQLLIVADAGAGLTSQESLTAFDVGAEEFPTSCFGNGASLNPGCVSCPCSNDAPGFTRGGCVNSTLRWADLRASGVPSVSADTLQLEVRNAAPETFALLFAGGDLLPVAGSCPPGSGVLSAPVIDGIRCVGSGASIVRLGVRATTSTGSSASAWGGGLPAAGLIAFGGFSAGETRHFQCFYRDDTNQTCGTGQNSTNAVSVTFVP